MSSPSISLSFSFSVISPLQAGHTIRPSGTGASHAMHRSVTLPPPSYYLPIVHYMFLQRAAGFSMPAAYTKEKRRLNVPESGTAPLPAFAATAASSALMPDAPGNRSVVSQFYLFPTSTGAAAPPPSSCALPWVFQALVSRWPPPFPGIP